MKRNIFILLILASIFIIFSTLVFTSESLPSLIKSIKPSVVIVFAYDINGEISTTINKMKNIGVKVVVINEYLEPSILGQAEWSKFFAEFFDKHDLAVAKFNETAKKYNSLKKKAETNFLKIN